MVSEYYKGIKKIQYEGPESDNPLSFKFYDPDKIIAGKKMSDHFKFAIAYWHSFCNNGSDPFGKGTLKFEWNDSRDPIQAAKNKADAAFEFIEKIGFEYFCFHDFDLVEESPSLYESEKRLEKILAYIKEKKEESKIKVLWGTANCFSHPRYMNGAATNPNFNIVARAGAQVKIALDATMYLDGDNYVFWGGREGYMSLLNTDMKKEIDNMATFLTMAKDYARSQGFKGSFLIEPKPMEPMKHQYDFDASTTIGFIKEYGLEKDFKLNIEVNHATLAQHTMQHELSIAAKDGMLGSIDANRGDYQNGWDTDQFGGLKGGGINFDAKIRRNSTDKEDLFHAHIGGADTFARALIAAEKIISSSSYLELRESRYKSFNFGVGKNFADGKLKLKELYQIAMQDNETELESGKQELFENIVNQYI